MEDQNTPQHPQQPQQPQQNPNMQQAPQQPYPQGHYQPPKKKRPTFLLVLCILSFIGGGLGVLGGLYTVLTYDFTMSQMEASMNAFEDLEDMGGIMGDMANIDFESMMEASYYNSMANLLMSIISLIGVYMMLKLRKVGFYLYTFAQIAILGAGIYFSLGMASGMGGFFGMAATFGVVFGAIFSIGFIVMYGVNLKHME